MWKLLFTICKRSCSPQLRCMGTSSETSKSGRRDISSTAVSKTSYQCQASVTSFALSNQKTFTLTKARRRSLKTLGLLPISPSPSAPVHEIKDTCMNTLGLSGVRRLFSCSPTGCFCLDRNSAWPLLFPEQAGLIPWQTSATAKALSSDTTQLLGGHWEDALD